MYKITLTLLVYDPFMTQPNVDLHELGMAVHKDFINEPVTFYINVLSRFVRCKSTVYK